MTAKNIAPAENAMHADELTLRCDKKTILQDITLAIPPRVPIVVASLEPRTLGAAMKEISGTLRTIIQGPGSSSAVAA
jgi:hypothetical protein